MHAAGQAELILPLYREPLHEPERNWNCPSNEAREVEKKPLQLV
jgi:hypothetical protein